MFVKLYKAFVRPHLEYAQVIWSPHLKRHIDIVENVQIRATKLVDGLQNLDYRERLQRLNLQTLAFRRLRGDIIEMHKHFHRYDKRLCPTRSSLVKGQVGSTTSKYTSWNQKTG